MPRNQDRIRPCLPHAHMHLQVRLQHVLAALNLLLGRHLVALHQLNTLCHDRVLAHGRDCHDSVTLGIKRRKGRLIRRRLALDNDIIIPAILRARMPTVAQLHAERGPKHGDERLGLGVGVDDVACDGAAGILRHVPMLDAHVGALVGVGCDVADGVDVGLAEDGKVLVDAEGAVLFHADVGLVLEELCRGLDADALDDNVGGEFLSALEVDGADAGGVLLIRAGVGDLGVHDELDAVLLQDPLEDFADFGAEDGLGGRRLHADDGDGVLVVCEEVGDLHADEGGADDDDALGGVAEGGGDGLCVLEGAEQEDVVELAGAETVEREAVWRGARGEDEFGVGVGFAGLDGDGLGGEVDVGDLGFDHCDVARLVEVVGAPGGLVEVGEEGFGELGAVVGPGRLA